jgi:hypothetical protein
MYAAQLGAPLIDVEFLAADIFFCSALQAMNLRQSHIHDALKRAPLKAPIQQPDSCVFAPHVLLNDP